MKETYLGSKKVKSTALGYDNYGLLKWARIVWRAPPLLTIFLENFPFSRHISGDESISYASVMVGDLSAVARYFALSHRHHKTSIFDKKRNLSRVIFFTPSYQHKLALCSRPTAKRVNWLNLETLQTSQQTY